MSISTMHRTVIRRECWWAMCATLVFFLQPTLSATPFLKFLSSPRRSMNSLKKKAFGRDDRVCARQRNAFCSAGLCARELSRHEHDTPIEGRETAMNVARARRRIKVDVEFLNLPGDQRISLNSHRMMVPGESALDSLCRIDSHADYTGSCWPVARRHLQT